MKLVEQFRGRVVDASISHGPFALEWPQRRKTLLRDVPASGPENPRQLVDVGLRLSEAFRQQVYLRDQSGTSTAGDVWHRLVLWYLNMIYAGSSAVVVSKRFAPQSLKDALKVSYPTGTGDGDLDLAFIAFPSTVGASHGLAADAVQQFRNELDLNFDRLYVCLLALKTNWNDLIQGVLFWNLLYSLRVANQQIPAQVGLSIGSNGRSLDQLAGFKNAFVTVPTNKLPSFKPTTAPVRRASTMTGGHYWGYPAVDGVAPNISRFPDDQAAVSSLCPPASSAGFGMYSELRMPEGRVDLAAFDLFPSQP